MERLTEIEHRIANLHELQNVVAAMRSLAAIRVQEAREVIDGMRAFTEAIDTALASAILLGPEAPPAPAGRGATLALAFCGEHGFVGAFNDRILNEAARLTPGRDDALAIIGARGLALGEGLGRRVLWGGSQAAKAASLTEVARRAADALYGHLSAGVFGNVVLVFARATGAVAEIVSRPILPFDIRPYREDRSLGQPPLHTLPPDALLQRLIDEFVFGEIMRAAAESFASEHAARLVAMDGAHRNIEDMLEALTHAAHRSRQEEITEELMDVVTGAQALLGR